MNLELDPPLRLARDTDAAQLAELVNFAGEGLPLHVWTGLASDGQDPWDVGRMRQAEKAREGKIVVVDYGDGAVAGLIDGDEGGQAVLVGAPVAVEGGRAGLPVAGVPRVVGQLLVWNLLDAVLLTARGQQ